MKEVEVTPELMSKLEAAGIRSLRAVKDNPDSLWTANLSRSDVAELQAAFDESPLNGVVFVPVCSDPEPAEKRPGLTPVPIVTLSEVKRLASLLGITGAALFSASESLALAEIACREKINLTPKEGQS